MGGKGLQSLFARMLLTVLTIGMMVLIFRFSMEKADDSDRTSGRFSRIVISVLYPEYESYDFARKQEIYDDIQFRVRKTAHFTEYAALGLLLRLCLESWFGKRKWIPVCGWTIGTLYACSDELHQLLTDGRSGQWTDVLLDSAGVFAGVAAACAALYMFRRKKRNGGSVSCP